MTSTPPPTKPMPTQMKGSDPSFDYATPKKSKKLRVDGTARHVLRVTET
jgi:hypothetical protein